MDPIATWKQVIKQTGVAIHLQIPTIPESAEVLLGDVDASSDDEDEEIDMSISIDAEEAPSVPNISAVEDESNHKSDDDVEPIVINVSDEEDSEVVSSTRASTEVNDSICSATSAVKESAPLSSVAPSSPTSMSMQTISSISAVPPSPIAPVSLKLTEETHKELSSIT